jgi:hypothetical protein
MKVDMGWLNQGLVEYRNSISPSFSCKLSHKSKFISLNLICWYLLFFDHENDL